MVLPSFWTLTLDCEFFSCCLRTQTVAIHTSSHRRHLLIQLHPPSNLEQSKQTKKGQYIALLISDASQ